MAKSQGLDEASLADIHRRYGDHLYAKGDFDGAMQQYLQTLGNLQPSYVIRKVSSTSLLRLVMLIFVQVP
jgi:Tfp pilus assembly protein PilF